MPTFLIIIFSILGAIGGLTGLVTYFSPTARSIRQSDAKIRKISEFDKTIDLLVKAKDLAEKEIKTLKTQMAVLIKDGDNKTILIKKLKQVIAIASNCAHNKGNCPIEQKIKELEL